MQIILSLLGDYKEQNLPVAHAFSIKFTLKKSAMRK